MSGPPFDPPAPTRYTAPVDDAKLTAAQAGRARARAAVLRALQNGWYRYAISQLLSVSAARDATQEAGLRVLHRLSAFDRSEPIETWSLGAVVQAVREVRALGGDAPPLLAAARRAGLSAAPPPYRPQVAGVADGLSAVLAPLTDEQREAVALRAVGGRPLPQAARLLGADLAAVRANAIEGLRTLNANRPAGQRLRAVLDECRTWSTLARYPGDLRAELFRAHKPAWLVPAALGTLAASGLLIGVANHFRPPVVAPATVPTTVPATVPTGK